MPVSSMPRNDGYNGGARLIVGRGNRLRIRIQGFGLCAAEEIAVRRFAPRINCVIEHHADMELRLAFCKFIEFAGALPSDAHLDISSPTHRCA